MNIKKIIKTSRFYSRSNSLMLKVFAQAAIAVVMQILVALLFISKCGAYDFPKPRGEFAVGTMLYHWHDINRQEMYSSDPTARRELLVQCWYPGDKQAEIVQNDGPKSSKELYLQSSLPHLLKMARESYGVPEFFLNSIFSNVYVHAQPKLALSTKKDSYPVIIFSHGMGSMSSLETVYAENLASHGYIVFGINHTYDCAITIFPDGRIIPLNFKWNQPGQVEYLDRVIDLWTADVRFVIDLLPVIYAQDSHRILTGRIDYKRLGVFGHSMGGGTMAKVCSLDKRVLAGVNFDGPVFDKHLPDGFATPFMFMMADGTLLRCSKDLDKREVRRRNVTAEESLQMRRAFKDNTIELYHKIKLNNGKTYYLVFKNAGHFTFTDAPLIKYMSSLFQCVEYFGFDVGSIDPNVALRVSNAYLLSFFNTYVCEEKSDSLFEPYCFVHPEVQMVG